MVSENQIKFKLIEIQKFALYWDSDTSLVGDLPSKDLNVSKSGHFKPNFGISKIQNPHTVLWYPRIRIQNPWIPNWILNPAIEMINLWGHWFKSWIHEYNLVSQDWKPKFMTWIWTLESLELNVEYNGYILKLDGSIQTF